jgi:hypothetical protein
MHIILNSLRCGFAAGCFLGLRVQIPPGQGCVSCDCRVLSGRGLWDRPIPHPEKLYWVLCVCLCVRARARARVTDVIRCKNNALHLRWVDRRGQTKKIFWRRKSAETLGRIREAAVTSELQDRFQIIVSVRGKRTRRYPFPPDVIFSTQIFRSGGFFLNF